MHRPFVPDPPPDVVTLAAATWLACGVVLLGLTPMPLRDATLGWAPAFWLLAAPALLLSARRMCMRQPLARRSSGSAATRTRRARRRLAR